MQQPVDGRGWKDFDTKYLDFTAEPRNVRLGLAADGFNPFGNLSKGTRKLNLGGRRAGRMHTRQETQNLRLNAITDKNGPVPIKFKFGDRDNLMPLDDHAVHCYIPLNNEQNKPTQGDIGETRLQQYLQMRLQKPIIELCLFFKQICSQTLMEDDMLKAQSKVVDILCNLELIYPPAFFDIMIHLVIHLPLEALEGGPIRPRWMFPFERFMKKLKGYVRNKAKPEGSIAEGYVAEEALTFSSHYFREFDAQELKKVIWYVLHNSPEIDTYRSQFKSKFPNKGHEREVPNCLTIRQRHVDNDPGVSATSELFALACGPTPTPISVNSCVVNGVRFVVHSRDERRTTQNSGICSPGGNDGEMYYGQLQEILEFSYLSFDDEDLVNVEDDDGVDMSADVARGHDGDGGGDDRPPSHHIPTGCGGCFANRGRCFVYQSWTDGHGGAEGGRSDQNVTQFDLTPHMQSQRWADINAGIQQHLQKLYNTNKASLKAAHWVIYPERDFMMWIRSYRESEQHYPDRLGMPRISFWNDPRTSPSRSNSPKSSKRHGRFAGRDPDHLVAFEMRWLQHRVGLCLPLMKRSMPGLERGKAAGALPVLVGSLGKVARERIPGELSPSNYPGRHVARDEYPSDMSPGEGVEMSLGILIPGDMSPGII
ncbi:hypothetical protein Tco_0830030 [Tanacetum coccineum]